MKKAVIIALSVFLLISANPLLMAEDEVTSLINEARTKAEAESYNEAIAIYEHILTQFPAHQQAPRAGVLIGHIKTKLDDREGAMEAYKYVAETYPQSEQAPNAKRSVAFSYIAKDETDSAIMEFTELVARYPASPQAPAAQLRLGYLYAKKHLEAESDADKHKYHEKTYNTFDALVKLFPNERNLCAEAEMHKAAIIFEKCIERKGSYSEAERKLNMVLEAYPDAPRWIRARLNLMLSEVALMKYDRPEAVARAEYVIEQFPNCRKEVGFAKFVAAQAYEGLEDYQMALNLYTSMVEGDYKKEENFKDRDVTLYGLFGCAETNLKLDKVDEAIALYETVVNHYPDTLQAKFAMNRLADLGGAR